MGTSAGGESGIRTHGDLRLAGFQDRFLQPLGHLSIAERRLVLNTCSMIPHYNFICQHFISLPPQKVFSNFFDLGVAFSGNVCYYYQGAIIIKLLPGVAQLVAHLTGGQGVVSSSLATRTNRSVQIWALRFLCMFITAPESLWAQGFPLRPQFSYTYSADLGSPMSLVFPGSGLHGRLVLSNSPSATRPTFTPSHLRLPKIPTLISLICILY